MNYTYEISLYFVIEKSTLNVNSFSISSLKEDIDLFYTNDSPKREPFLRTKKWLYENYPELIL